MANKEDVVLSMTVFFRCLTTDFIKDKDVINYGQTIGKTKNPLIFHLVKVSVRMKFYTFLLPETFFY